MAGSLRVYLVDDEPLAIERLARLLEEFPEVSVVGSATDPAAALDFLSREAVDAVFLDIQMPGISGFELLARLREQPLVIFTTAYDQYALRAFEVNSIDFLLKPVEPEELARAVKKLERLRGASPPEWMRQTELAALLKQLAAAVHRDSAAWPERITSKVGERVYLIDLANVTHFFARDKLTYAVSDGKNYAIDQTIAELERKLDPRRFVRIHRSTLLNLNWVAEVHSRFGGQPVAILKDEERTVLPVARDRAGALRERLAI